MAPLAAIGLVTREPATRAFNGYKGRTVDLGRSPNQRKPQQSGSAGIRTAGRG